MSNNTSPERPNHWPLQAAKSRFSELVRRVQRDGPHHVTVHGNEEVVVISAAEFRRLKGTLTGEALVDALQSSPYRDVSLEPTRAKMSVRDINL